jgi:hypothetical protein
MTTSAFGLGRNADSAPHSNPKPSSPLPRVRYPFLVLGQHLGEDRRKLVFDTEKMEGVLFIIPRLCLSLPLVFVVARKRPKDSQ